MGEINQDGIRTPSSPKSSLPVSEAAIGLYANPELSPLGPTTDGRNQSPLVPATYENHNHPAFSIRHGDNHPHPLRHQRSSEPFYQTNATYHSAQSSMGSHQSRPFASVSSQVHSIVHMTAHQIDSEPHSYETMTSPTFPHEEPHQYSSPIAPAATNGTHTVVSGQVEYVPRPLVPSAPGNIPPTKLSHRHPYSNFHTTDLNDPSSSRSSPDAPLSGDPEDVDEREREYNEIEDRVIGSHPRWMPPPEGGESFATAKGTKVTLPRYYAHVNTGRDINYDRMTIVWRTPDRYQITRRIGRGKYSEVFSGVEVNERDEAVRDVVIKVLKPVKKRKQKREIFVLKHVSGGPCIVPLIDVVRDPVGKNPALIFESINSLPLCDVTSSPEEIRFYMFHVLMALDYSHSRGVIHRDIKPHNVIVDPLRKLVHVVDWGLAGFYHPGAEYNTRVASRYYKGPELLVNFMNYDYSLDIWSLGAMFAGLIFHRDPFFWGADNADVLKKIVKVMGSDVLEKYIGGLSLNLPKGILSRLAGLPATDWHDYIPPTDPENTGPVFATPEAIHCLDALLRVDHRMRICAHEALILPYFKPIRQMYIQEYNVDFNLPLDEWRSQLIGANKIREELSIAQAAQDAVRNQEMTPSPHNAKTTDTQVPLGCIKKTEPSQGNA